MKTFNYTLELIGENNKKIFLMRDKIKSESKHLPDIYSFVQIRDYCNKAIQLIEQNDILSNVIARESKNIQL